VSSRSEIEQLQAEAGYHPDRSRKSDRQLLLLFAEAVLKIARDLQSSEVAARRPGMLLHKEIVL
jgi:hypothetical protein